MKVLHLASSFPRHAEDHHAPFMGQLMLAQQSAGIETLVLAPHDAGLRVREELGPTTVYRFRYAPGSLEVLGYRGGLMGTARTPVGAVALPGYMAAFAARAIRLARTGQADVIHAHWWLPAGLAGAVAARASGLPLVITCHGTDVELAGRPGLRALSAAVLRRADLVAAVSESLAARLRLGPAPDCRVLRMPLARLPRPTDGGTPDPEPGARRNRGALQLLCIGRLSKEKGFDLAVAAVAGLGGQGSEVRLDIVGDGPERATLETAARACSGLVTLRGALSPEALRVAIDACDAVLVPSRHEGLGLVALEAMARGRPVIASAVGGLVDVVAPEDGLLVPPEDVGALMAAIRCLPLPAPAGAALVAHDPERVGQEHRAAYEEILAGRARATRPDRPQ